MGPRRVLDAGCNAVDDCDGSGFTSEAVPDSDVPCTCVHSASPVQHGCSTPPPAARLDHPDAVLSRTDLRELGYQRRAVDAIFRACPVVALPGYKRPLIRVRDFNDLIARSTYLDDGRVRP